MSTRTGSDGSDGSRNFSIASMKTEVQRARRNVALISAPTSCVVKNRECHTVEEVPDRGLQSGLEVWQGSLNLKRLETEV